MAVDQAILESVNSVPDAIPTLRIYRWSPATLSLGYFQRYDDRQLHPSSQDCDVVRRASGGGAIMHDQEITYSLTVPSANRWAKKNQELYSLVHEAIIEVLASEYAVPSQLFANAAEHKSKDSPPKFLCFLRRSEGDIVCKGSKIVGSAQRRHKSAVLQHGSVLLATSKFAPELAGIFQVMQTEFDSEQFARQFSAAVCQRLNFLPELSELSADEVELTKQYEETKFANDDWTIRRFKSS